MKGRITRSLKTPEKRRSHATQAFNWPRNHSTRYILLFAGLILFLILAWQFIWPVFAPVILAFILAYLIYPAVKRLEKRMPRVAAISVVYVTLLVIIVSAVVFIIPVIMRELRLFIEELPGYLQAFRESTSELQKIIANLGIEDGGDIEKAILNSMTGFLNSVESLGPIINWIGIIALAPFLAFFFLKDREYFEKRLAYFIPSGRRLAVSETLKEINTSMRRYLNGQMIIALISFAVLTAGFFIIGLDSALMLALMLAFFGLIPYIGPVIGSIPVVLIAVSRGGPLIWYALLVVVISCQLVYGIISPKIQGDVIGVHPVLAVVSMLAGLSLIGVVGALLALPILITLKITISRLFFSKVHEKEAYKV